jgi:hypothetical protein
MTDLRALDLCMCEHKRSEHECREASCKTCGCDLFMHQMSHPGNPIKKYETEPAAE